MAHYTIDILQEYKLPVEQVFDVLSDHNRLTRILGVPVKRIVDGHDSPNGVGSVRLLGIGPLSLEETVYNCIENDTIHYRISRGGAPLKNHTGDVNFYKTVGGSRVNWIIHFDAPPVIGRLVQQVLGLGIKMGLKRIR